MKKRIFLYAVLPVFLLVPIVSALSYTFDFLVEFPNEGGTYTTTLSLDPTSEFTATISGDSGEILAYLPGSVTTTIPFTTTIPLTTTIPPTTLTATLPPQDWPEIGIMWSVPYDGSSFTITIRPSGQNVIPEPSSMLLLLTGVILLTGLFLKEKLFKS